MGLFLLLHKISIHAPREGSDRNAAAIRRKTEAISIHAPREGSDPASYGKSAYISRFLSTLPVRGATRTVPSALPMQTISIHAPREGSDPFSVRRMRSIFPFLSTLPVRGATKV